MFLFGIRRLLTALVALWGMATVVFLLLRVLPGDPAETLLAGSGASPEAIALTRQQMGLDDPLPVQYGRYLLSTARGDLGRSLFSNRPVTLTIAEQLPATLHLAVAEWLEARIPDGTVWYGGDSSGVCAKPLERHVKNRLWEHFVEHGHHPYNNHFDNDGVRPVADPHNPGQPRPVCEFCGGEPMMRNGWGKDYAAFHCEGCGDRVVRKDGEERWQSRGELDKADLR